MKKSTWAMLSLILVAFVWGSGFTATKVAFESVGPIYQIFFRFGIAAFILAIIFFKQLKGINKTIIKQSFFLALSLFLTYLTSSIGLKMTTVSKAAFFCGIAVVFVPFMSFAFFKTKLQLKSMVSVAACVGGLFLMSYSETSAFNLNLGDILCLICSICYALQIVFTGKYVADSNPILLTILQMAMVSLMGLVVGFFFETLPATITTTSWMAILYLGALCTAFSFLAQTVSQKYIDSSKVAIILAIEPIFAAFVAFILLGERLGRNGILGAILIVGSLIFSELNLSSVFKKTSL